MVRLLGAGRNSNAQRKPIEFFYNLWWIFIYFSSFPANLKHLPEWTSFVAAIFGQPKAGLADVSICTQRNDVPAPDYHFVQ